MKKSLIYKKAQFAVLACGLIIDGEKLEILRELMEKEDLELFVEKQAEEKAKEESGEICEGA